MSLSSGPVAGTVLALSLALAAAPAVAQEDIGARLSIELNTADTVENACRISFLVQNGHAAHISQVVYEAVLFDNEGQVERLTLFDFGGLPAARPRVRQFLIPDLDCASLSRVLINGAETCTGENLPQDACTRNLDLRSRTDMELLG